MTSIFRKIGFFVAFVIPALVIIGYYVGGVWNYLTLFFAFLVLPLLDQVLGIDTRNVPGDKVKKVGDEFYYRFVTYIWTYVQIAMVVWGAYAVTSGKLQTPWEWLGFALSFSLVSGGIGITVAHELGHKKQAIERFYSKLLLMTVCYMHFYIEHNRGHHVTVATRRTRRQRGKMRTFLPSGSGPYSEVTDMHGNWKMKA
jgi:alkane 1-monooxygenase